MRLIRLQSPIRAILFDIDNTLYRNDAYANGQIDALIGRFARERGIDGVAANEMVSASRRAIHARTGRRPSLANALVALGIPIEQSVRWREELVEPERYLRPEPAVVAAVGELARRVPIVALTNNPVSIGTRSMRAMGLSTHIGRVIGLDSTWHSKPDWEPFAAACAAVEQAPDRVVMIGDRVDVDLLPIVDRGGSAILVEATADVGRLPLILGPYFP